MKQFSARAKGAAALVAIGAFTTTLLVEPISCSRRDDMQSFGSVAVKEKAPTQKEVLDKIQNARNIAQVSSVVFGFLKEDAPKEQKYSVVDSFSAKFKEDALREFFRNAHVDFGFEFNGGIEKFKVEEPGKISYMQALTHGFFDFGDAGLRYVVTLISVQPDPSPFAIFKDRDSPLTAQIGLMVCAKLKKYEKMDAKAAVEYITPYLSKKDITDTAKKSLLGLLGMIDPASLDAIAKNPSIDPYLKEIAAELRNKTGR